MLKIFFLQKLKMARPPTTPLYCQIFNCLILTVLKIIIYLFRNRYVGLGPLLTNNTVSPTHAVTKNISIAITLNTSQNVLILK